MNRPSATIIWSIAAAILGVIALQVANGSALPIAGDPALLILAGTFLSMMVVMALVSFGNQMRLSLQIMAIYFTIYLLLPGFNHASVNRFPFFNFSYPLAIRVDAAWMIAIFLVTVLGGYAIAGRIKSQTTAFRAFEIRNNTGLAVVMTVAAIISLVVFLRTVGFSGAFAVRSAEDTSGLDIASTGLLTGLPRAITFLPVIYALMIVAHSRHRAFGYVILAISLPILLVVNFPLAIPRSQLFGNLLLFSIILIDFKKPSLRGSLSLAFLFGALVAVPVLDHFTRQGGTWATLDPRRLSSVYFSTGDFDGFQSVNNAIVYVERFGLQGGLQLISALLFFVPRAIWPDKALPTGTITSEAAGYTFNNVSQPLPSELFVDFGWSGVVIGGLLLGLLFYRFDRWIDRGWEVDPRVRLAAGWLVGFGLPVYRGTLLGVLPPFIILAGGLWMIARWGTRPAPAVRHD